MEHRRIGTSEKQEGFQESLVCCVCSEKIEPNEPYYCVGGESFHMDCCMEFAKAYFEEFKRR